MKNNTLPLSPNVDNWPNELAGLRKPRAYSIVTPITLNNNRIYEKRDKLKKDKNHNTYAKLPTKYPRCMVRALPLRDILKLEKNITLNNLRTTPDKDQLIIVTPTTKYTLKLFTPQEIGEPLCGN